MEQPVVVSDEATAKNASILEDTDYGETLTYEEGSATSSTTYLQEEDDDDDEGGLQSNSIENDGKSNQSDEDNVDNDDISSSTSKSRVLYRRFSDRSENHSFGASNRSKLSAVMEMSIEWSEEFSVDGHNETNDFSKFNRSQHSTGTVAKAASLMTHNPMNMAKGSDTSNTRGDSESPICTISNFPRTLAKGSKQAAVGAVKSLYNIPKNIAKGSKQAAVGISKMPKAVANGSKQAAVGISKMPKAVAKGSKQAAVGISKVPQAVVKGSKQATIGISKFPETVIKGSKQAAVGISKVPQAVAKGSMRAAVAMAHAPKGIVKGIQQNRFHESSFFLEEEDHDPPNVHSYLGGRRRGLVHNSAGSDTINGSSMSIISTVSSYRESFSTSSSSSLPVIALNGNTSEDSASRAASSLGNSSDRRNNRTSHSHSLSSDHRGSLRSSLSSMPSLATITHDDLSSMPHNSDSPPSIFDVDSRTSWTTCTSRGSIRTLSPIPSPSSSRRIHRGTLFSSIRDDTLVGRIMDELPSCQLSLNHKDPEKEHRRWDCSLPATGNLIPLDPLLTDTIPTYSTRYSSSRLSDANLLVAGDGSDLTRALPLDRDVTVCSPPTLFSGGFGRRIHPVPALVLTSDETPQAARRRSSGSITMDSTDVPAQRPSWSDSSVSSTKRRSSTSAFPLPTLIEGGAVPCCSPRSGMAEVAAMVADALGDEWSESETELPLE